MSEIEALLLRQFEKLGLHYAAQLDGLSDRLTNLEQQLNTLSALLNNSSGALPALSSNKLQSPKP